MLFTVVATASLLAAIFFGHAIHWALHQRWSRVFNRAHMEHHELLYPPGRLSSDKYRMPRWYHRGVLLFTPGLIILLGAAGGLFWLLGAPWWTLIVFAVVLIGFGLFNDVAHDTMHIRKHPLMKHQWYRRMRKLHYLHHVDMSKNYGIINFSFDRLFGTFIDKR